MALLVVEATLTFTCLMDSDVAYVRQTNEGEPSSSYDQRYSQYDAQPAGYAEYGHGASEPVSLDSHEEFDPPAHNHKPIPLDFATAALYGAKLFDF